MGRVSISLLVLPLLLPSLSLGGCVSPGLDAPGQVAELDRAYFDCRVQPVLTKYCATFACHGDGRRFLRVYARNRLRLGGDERQRNAFMRPSERAANFVAAGAMVDPDDPEQSLLLLKPLQQAAGGYYHGGETAYGAGDVFADVDDTDYQVLVSWVGGERAEPDCIEPGSDQ